MILRTETVMGASPEILAAIVAASDGEVMPYGDDPATTRLQTQFSELFGRPVDVFPTVSGTASNALAMAVSVAPYTSAYCHQDAHLVDGEAGAFEFFTGGGRLVGVHGQHGKLSAEDLDERLHDERAKHSLPRPAAISVTQLTEAGTLYTAAELQAIGGVAKRHGLVYHMDGARFANAVAATGCSAAELSCDAGVDILSFGATKNGTLMADAIVVFTPELAKTLRVRQKRAGHTVAKMRFLSAQLEAYLRDGLWLRNATQANDMARLLATSLSGLPGLQLQYEVQGNELFLVLSEALCGEIKRRSIAIRQKSVGRDGEGVFRIVTSFDTSEATVADLAVSIRSAAGA